MSFPTGPIFPLARFVFMVCVHCLEQIQHNANMQSNLEVLRIPLKLYALTNNLFCHYLQLTVVMNAMEM